MAQVCQGRVSGSRWEAPRTVTMRAFGAAAAYRLLGLATDKAGRARITRLNDRMLARMAAPEVFAAIHADGYWFDGARPSWAAVMAGGRPELLREVTAPVLIVRGQFDQLGLDARRYAAAPTPVGSVAAPIVTRPASREGYAAAYSIAT